MDCLQRSSFIQINRPEGSINRGLLPKQAHGTKFGGDPREAQVLRRYDIATFFFATSGQVPWTEEWNFLSENVHECAWHHNKTRQNVPYGEFDHAVFLCMKDFKIMLDDIETEIVEIALDARSE